MKTLLADWCAWLRLVGIYDQMPDTDRLTYDELLVASQTFPDPSSWSIRMRRALVPLAPADAREIARHLEPFVQPYAKASTTYEALAPASGLRPTFIPTRSRA